MKKYLLLLFVCVFLMSCSDDSTSDLQEDDMEMPDDNSDGNTTKLTYTQDIAPIISSNCLSCHGSPTRNGAPSSYNTFQLVSSAASRMDGRMNNANNPMPASGLIFQGDRDKFKQWISDGKLE